jgi:type I restriction enzyme, R subunit
MNSRPGESHFELTTIERLEGQGYRPEYGLPLREDESFPLQRVVREDLLRSHLRKAYPDLPENAIEEAVRQAVANEGVTLVQRNLSFHQKLTRGLEIRHKTVSGKDEYQHVYLVDWDTPEANDFRVVNQLPVKGQNDRRPDIIIYVNGLPLVVFELKNPNDEHTTAHGAYNQIQHYSVDIPQLFEYNTFCVVSDGTSTLHGMWSADWEWYAPWKSIDGHTVEPSTTGSMKALVEGLFPQDRLLDYIRHFIVFEQEGDAIVKKGAKYHQFFGVRFAVDNAVRSTEPQGDRRIGVIWHTQGSGKSLSMIFLVGILRRTLNNPTFIIQVDRTDLDEQLYDGFVRARSLVGEVQHAESVEELRTLLNTEGGEVIFTTVEKFRLREDELQHPVLSERRNIIVIADEAHRTQYGFDPRLRLHRETGQMYTAYGYAKYLRDALPNASFIGFTGTPVDESDRDTQAIFGDIIHTYDIPQAQADGAIVPIYYEPRMAPLHLVNERVDEDLEEIAEGEEQEKLKSTWARIEAAAGTQDRIRAVAKDIVDHYEKRTGPGGVFGKAMIVCMSRRICVALYDEITSLRPDWHQEGTDRGQIKVVMTGDLSKDPKEWSEAGHITTKERREQIKERMKDPEDPLKMVIVRDMWLTGTDIPCLHTLYVDKPMKGHSIMQAIARVNRVFRDKPGGLVVDYIGVGHLLKEAAAKYRKNNFGEPVEDLDEAARGQFYLRLEEIRSLLPAGTEVATWRSLSNIELEDLTSYLLGYFVETDERRDDYLLAEKNLTSAYSLVKHLEDVNAHADEVAFYQMVRAQLRKTLPPAVDTDRDRERAVRDLVDRSLSTDGIVDIFEAAGLDKPDISVLDEAFLEEFKSKQQENLRLKLLEKLLQDEIRLRQRSNLKKYRSFREMLESTLERYHAGTITAAEVVQAMVQIRKEIQEEDRRKKETGLTDEELAFYDAIAELQAEAYDMPFLCDLVRDVVETVKRNLKVDWTKPHRDNVKANVQAAVKLVLRRRQVRGDHFQFILNRIMEQAEARYEDWPMVA